MDKIAKEMGHITPEKISGLKRVWINSVTPDIDCGSFPAKYIINDLVTIKANIFCDGIDEIIAQLHYKNNDELGWSSVDFSPLSNDQWEASFEVNRLGIYSYIILAWTSEFLTWRVRFFKKLTLDYDIDAEKSIGIKLIKSSYKETTPPCVQEALDCLSSSNDKSLLVELLSNKELEEWMKHNLASEFVTQSDKSFSLSVDPVKARFSTWYELFPRSVTQDPKKHGHFKDLINHLPIIKNMGFDVLYLPPIHPIGEKNRKGKNNELVAQPDDPGSPWAIGSSKGGHKSIHPQLGSFKDFASLIKAAKKLNLDIALDIALQCSPDHPYLSQHEIWFKHRPDGTLQYAENPPKKYQDIYPLNFSSSEWPSLWNECKDIFLFWIQKGVTIFRVDNPHTKPFIFWQWLIHEIKTDYPETIFLAEAFTRPSIMYLLAKCGFTQSYTYFTWRNTKSELISYMNELNSAPVKYYFRPNFWPNTPDILNEYLQEGGQIAFMVRLILAATLSSNYGIYGPAFENCIREPLHEGSEEYLDSEKYSIHCWQKTLENISDLIRCVNQIRHHHPALQNTHSVQFYPSDNDQIICYSKHSPDFKDVILVVVNLDYQYKQSAFVTLDLSSLGIEGPHYYVHDLLSEERYQWQSGACYVELNPLKQQCAHIFHIKGKVL
ncbi:alpha-1,4-glucan--maltose-1-phosphate maltosyltransferase [Legionella saoudiensis]|uniref:alpha-1,4-glucan--maltose-1-phosphate maltosyltransferase n=1 Tax=Legionella saoudiensis TaxID=1750561 RepID=UPI000AA73DB7|nr:alpha-1,4-glucan--maltose-1-phosphate maltosyltransferase [Legionella saoudiensis]